LRRLGVNMIMPALRVPGGDMRRRSFLCGSLAMLAAPIAAEAQPGKVPRKANEYSVAA
jgi:hypothetical protein